MHRNRYIKTSLLLLVLFLAYQAGGMMFSHIHYINGVMIVHSHPSKDSHTHTEGQIISIAQTASFVTTEPSSIILENIFLPVLRYLYTGKVYSLYCADILHIRLRAPPSTLFL